MNEVQFPKVTSRRQKHIRQLFDASIFQLNESVHFLLYENTALRASVKTILFMPHTVYPLQLRNASLCLKLGELHFRHDRS